MRLVGSLVSLAALAIVPAARAQFANVDACSLLTASEAGAAIDVGVTGHHLMAGSKGECFWSDDTTADINHRRVTLSIIAQAAFDHTKTSPRLKTEPVAGVGDDAFYVSPGGGSVPIIDVKKGNVYFQIKILNGLKVKPPLKADDVKARELVLAKKAAGRA
jgi:hypothetical protein